MIYIIGPAISHRSWEQSYFIFAHALSKILIKNNLQNIITFDTKDIKENDLVFVFNPYYNNNINCKIIYINTDSVLVRPQIEEDIKDPNVKMIWDYQTANINILRKIGKPIHLIPLLYHEFLEDNFVKDNCEKSIDFLLYGNGSCNRRKDIINGLKKKKHNAVVYSTRDIYELYKMINKSKIIIIVAFYENAKEIDFYRISFLLANKIFFISEDTDDSELRQKVKDFCIFSIYDKFISTCEKYVKMSQKERDKICDNNYNLFKNNFKMEQFIPILQIKEII